MIRNLVNKSLWDFKPYEPGKPISELAREMGIARITKLASNENPFGPSPKALAAIRKAALAMHRYPDGSCYALKRKLSRNLKLSPQNIQLKWFVHIHSNFSVGT